MSGAKLFRIFKQVVFEAYKRVYSEMYFMLLNLTIPQAFCSMNNYFKSKPVL